MTETTETTAPETRDVRDLTDAELREVQANARASVREVNARRRAGTATGRDYREGTEAAREGVAARDELGRRIAESSSRSIVERLTRRASPLTTAREYDRELLDGVLLDSGKLSDAELSELRTLLKARRDLARAGEPWPDAERERAEALVGKSAGEPELYARRRDEVRRANEMRAEATKLARAFWPRRRDPEPGSVELPASLFGLLVNGDEDTFDLADLGLLAALAYSFASESAALFVRAEFVHAEGPSIVCRQSGAGVRLVRGADDTGHIRVDVSLVGLKQLGWVETHRHRGTFTIRPGERMRKLWQ